MRSRLHAAAHFTARASVRVLEARPLERAFVVAAWLVAPCAELGLRALGAQTWWKVLERGVGALGDARARLGLAGRSAGLSPERAEELVRWAFAAQPLCQHRCLNASSVQLLVQRAFGDEVIVVVGVRRGAAAGSIAAHAWVEAAERPRLDQHAVFSTIHVVARTEIRS